MQGVRKRTRLVIYSSFVAVALVVSARVQPTPQSSVNGLTNAVMASSERFLRCDLASVGIHAKRGWTLTVYVSRFDGFGPADFLVVEKIDGEARAELLIEDQKFGVMRQIMLGGAQYDAYMHACGLDVSDLDEAFRSRFTTSR
jgi:hypothetical protein